MKLNLFSILAILFLFTACKKPKEKEEFDRKGMLTNIASNVIIPSLASMENELVTLNEKAETFTANTNTTNLTSLKNQFNTTYLTFQRCKMFNFGPLDDYGIVSAMNTYPTDTNLILSNINSGNYILGSATNLAAIGLPAIDYLLYHASDNEIISNFSTSSEAANRKVYLTDITAKMKDEFTSAKSAWTSYESTFINADGNDVGSSTGIMFNSFVMDIELIKNAKIGIPAGYQTSGQTIPNYVEGYFAGNSIELAVENLTALKNLFEGGSGLSFDDYIRDVEDENVAVSLATNISNQFDLCISKVTEIGNPLSSKVDDTPTSVSNAWQEIKKLVTYSKTDMSSMLGLLITFQDNDGD